MIGRRLVEVGDILAAGDVVGDEHVVVGAGADACGAPGEVHHFSFGGPDLYPVADFERLFDADDNAGRFGKFSWDGRKSCQYGKITRSRLSDSRD